jgi:endonuclease/exonuclease/phosphatase family metal-dependent hydrolase
MAFGNAVLVRGRIHAARGVLLSESVLHEAVPSGDAPRAGTGTRGVEPRGLLLVGAEVEGFRFTFGSTHLAAQPEERAHQIRTLAAYLANNSQSDLPLVIAGDFNAQPHALASLREFLELTEPQPTYPSQSPRAAIDHVFFSNHWRCTGAFTVPAPASDHAALVVDLEPIAATSDGSPVY